MQSILCIIFSIYSQKEIETLVCEVEENNNNNKSYLAFGLEMKEKMNGTSELVDDSRKRKYACKL